MIVMLVLVICALPAQSIKAEAYNPIKTDQSVSAKLLFSYGEKAIPGAEFSAYRIAEVSEWAEFTAVGEFKTFSGTLNEGKTDSEWADLAEELADYIALHRMQPQYRAKTDDSGTAYFQNGMKPGLYLFLCKNAEYRGKIYSALPSIVCLPDREEASEEWVYENISVTVKAGTVRETPPTAPESPVPSRKPEGPPKLPQTGLLWWPVPVLLVFGFSFVALASFGRRS